MVLNLINQRKRRISKHDNSQLDVGILWVSYIYNMFDHVVDLFGFQGQFTRRFFSAAEAPSLFCAEAEFEFHRCRRFQGSLADCFCLRDGKLEEFQEIGCETGCNWCCESSYLPVPEAQVKSFDTVAKLLAT